MAFTDIHNTRNTFPDLRDAWRHRWLALALTQRNLKIRYVQTVLGAIWGIVHPIMMAGLLTVVFGIFLQMKSDGTPYVLFVFAGTVIWTAFNRALIDTSTSLAGSGGIIQKVYFPRILVPIASAMTGFVDVIPIFAVLLVCSFAISGFPGWILLFAPVFLLMAAVMAFSLGLAVTAIDAVFRDVRLIVPTLMQFVFYLTPVLYSETSLPERWQFVVRLNPFLGALQGFRWATIAGAPPPDLLNLGWTCLFTLIALVIAMLLFARFENFALDRI